MGRGLPSRVLVKGAEKAAHTTHLTQDQEEAGRGGWRGRPQWKPGKLELARGKRKGCRRGQDNPSRGNSVGQDGKAKREGRVWARRSAWCGRGTSVRRATDLLLAGADALRVEVPV